LSVSLGFNSLFNNEARGIRALPGASLTEIRESSDDVDASCSSSKTVHSPMEFHEDLHSPSAFSPPLNRRETTSSGDSFRELKDVMGASLSSPAANTSAVANNRSKTTLFTIDNIIGKP